MKATYINTPTSITANRRTVGTTAEVLNGSAKLGISADIYKQAAAPGGTASKNRGSKPSAGVESAKRLSSVTRHKVNEDSSNCQLSLFDDAGEPTAAREEMTAFFDRIRPLVADLNPADKLNIISGAYWVLAGENRETIAATLRKPLRGLFAEIIVKLKTK